MLAKYNLLSTVAIGSMPNLGGFPNVQTWDRRYDRLKVLGLMFYQIE